MGAAGVAALSLSLTRQGAGGGGGGCACAGVGYTQFLRWVLVLLSGSAANDGVCVCWWYDSKVRRGEPLIRGNGVMGWGGLV